MLLKYVLVQLDTIRSLPYNVFAEDILLALQSNQYLNLLTLVIGAPIRPLSRFKYGL